MEDGCHNSVSMWCRHDSAQQSATRLSKLHSSSSCPINLPRFCVCVCVCVYTLLFVSPTPIHHHTPPTGAFGERGLQVLQNLVLSLWSNHTSSVQQQHQQQQQQQLQTSPTTNTTDPSGTPSAAPASSSPSYNTAFYLTLYFALGLSSVGVVLVRSALLVLGSISASRRLHSQLLHKLLRLPMTFFDAQPSGECALVVCAKHDCDDRTSGWACGVGFGRFGGLCSVYACDTYAATLCAPCQLCQLSHILCPCISLSRQNNTHAAHTKTKIRSSHQSLHQGHRGS